MKLYFVRLLINGNVLGTHERGKIPLKEANKIARTFNETEKRHCDRESRPQGWEAVVQEARP